MEGPDGCVVVGGKMKDILVSAVKSKAETVYVIGVLD